MSKVNQAPSKIISFIIALSFFMEMVDSTIINTAIPSIAHSLSVDPVDLKVALISYLLSLAIFIPISGWLADKFGTKACFMTAIVIFTLSSLGCGFAQNLPQLVIGRFIQGLGGSLSLPVGRLILIRTFGRERLITTMNNVVMVGSMGMMLGPVFGGFITHYFSWQWIFWVNVPVGILAFFLAKFYLENAAKIKVPPLDILGFIVFGLALAGFTFGLSALSETTISPAVAIIILLISVILLIFYAWYSHDKPHPIVKTDLLRFRTFRVSVTGNLLARLGFGGTPFLVPLFLQIDFGLPAQISGLVVAPMAFGVVFGKPCVLKILRNLGYKHFLILNTLCAGIMLWLFMLVTKNTPLYIVGGLMLVYGFIITLQYSAMNSMAYADLKADEISSATSIMGTLQQIAQSFGVAASAILLHVFGYIFSENSILNTQIFHATFFVLGLVTIVSAFIFTQLQKNDGHQMIKPKSCNPTSSKL